MKTLIVRLDSAGDVLLAGPAVRAAAAHSEVAMLCGPQGREAAECLPGVGDVIVWDAPWVGFDPPPVNTAEVSGLIGALACRRFDRALILTSYHQSPLPTALVLRMAGVPWIGADCTDYPGSLLDLRHTRLTDRHEADAALDLAREAGFRLPADDPGGLRVQPPPDTSALTGAGPYVVVHPGASVPARAPSASTMRQAVRALARNGHRVVITGGPTEQDLTAEVAGADGLDLGGGTDLRQLAGVLAGARAVVVGNTGPAHLAAAVGTPVVCLFAPVVPAVRWRPYGVRHILLGRQDAPCADSRARLCPIPGHPCLDSISSERICDAVESLIAFCGHPDELVTERRARAVTASEAIL
jgi:ADP-heptose:LPS heptosyltransferase